MSDLVPAWWTEHEADAWEAAGFALRRDWAELDAGDPTLAWPALRLGYGAAVSAAYRAHATVDDAEAALVCDWAEVEPGRPWAAARDAVRYGWRRGRRTDSVAPAFRRR